MSEETIDYGQVTGMVHSTESFGSSRWAWYSLYCLFAGLSHALPVLPQPRHLGYGVQ
ncbi:pyruvate formate-lyase-activating enzyme [Streptococcus pneumoniae]|nr:pyruvate formate-lyase-activating enzyme [Streptococcus pneumoniae]